MFLRSASRAVARSAAIPSTASRTAASPMACLNAQKTSLIAPQQQTRAASEHAIANPTLAGIEKRWEAMPPQEQADLWMQLRDRMKVDWHQMTVQEKKAGTLFLYIYMCVPGGSGGGSQWTEEACRKEFLLICFCLAYWIAFGPHGPRAQPPKGEGLRIAAKTSQLILASVAVFYVIHLFAKPQPRTMTKEYQEASNEYAAVCFTLHYIYYIDILILVEWLLTGIPPTEGEDEPPLRRRFRAEPPGSSGIKWPPSIYTYITSLRGLRTM